MARRVLSGARNVAIVGPYLSGKTTLLESLLSVSGATTRKGSVTGGTSVGDAAPEARARQMGIDVNIASTEYNDVRFAFLDCPGSVELVQEAYNVLVGVDAAVVVCEPDPERMFTLSPLFQFLDAWEIPHLVFINKMERAITEIRPLLDALKAVSSRPLVLHQYPITEDSNLKGYIDLVSEQAYHYHPGAPADPIPLPKSLREAEQAAREKMLETLADFDDHLLEELLEDIEPSQDELIRDLKLDLKADLIVPVLIGSAQADFGVRPLLDMLVREAPEPQAAAERRHLSADATPVLQVLKTSYTPQGSKLSIARVWQGPLREGDVLQQGRIGGIACLTGQNHESVAQAEAGSVVALMRMDDVRTGDTLSLDLYLSLPKAEVVTPVYALAITPEQRSDDVKLSSALTKLVDEDPSLVWEQHGDTHEVILWGQGDIQLKIALDRLRHKYGLAMTTHMPHVPYKETIHQSASAIHGRYKRQSGGHGQFGDVYLDIAPLPRGGGVAFNNTIVGGVVPKQYIPGVEGGVREYLTHGPLGFPVVDVSITLVNGSYHTVDSSEQAFRQAARLAMQEGLTACKPKLLEPILSVTVSVPASFTANALRLVSTRRGQILGYEAKADWQGWDDVTAYLPQAEMQDFIIELRSLTMGVGSFRWQQDHLQEVPDKLTERILAILAEERVVAH